MRHGGALTIEEKQRTKDAPSRTETQMKSLELERSADLALARGVGDLTPQNGAI
jgi:hypothetical protein